MPDETMSKKKLWTLVLLSMGHLSSLLSSPLFLPCENVHTSCVRSFPPLHRRRAFDGEERADVRPPRRHRRLRRREKRREGRRSFFVPIFSSHHYCCRRRYWLVPFLFSFSQIRSFLHQRDFFSSPLFFFIDDDDDAVAAVVLLLTCTAIDNKNKNNNINNAQRP